MQSHYISLDPDDLSESNEQERADAVNEDNNRGMRFLLVNDRLIAEQRLRSLENTVENEYLVPARMRSNRAAMCMGGVTLALTLVLIGLGLGSYFTGRNKKMAAESDCSQVFEYGQNCDDGYAENLPLELLCDESTINDFCESLDYIAGGKVLFLFSGMFASLLIAMGVYQKCRNRGIGLTRDVPNLPPELTSEISEVLSSATGSGLALSTSRFASASTIQLLDRVESAREKIASEILISNATGLTFFRSVNSISREIPNNANIGVFNNIPGLAQHVYEYLGCPELTQTPEYEEEVRNNVLNY